MLHLKIAEIICLGFSYFTLFQVIFILLQVLNFDIIRMT